MSGVLGGCIFKASSASHSKCFESFCSFDCADKRVAIVSTTCLSPRTSADKNDSSVDLRLAHTSTGIGAWALGCL